MFCGRHSQMLQSIYSDIQLYLHTIFIPIKLKNFDLLHIFLIFVFGFIFMGWLTFGADLQAYNTFPNSFNTCWNFLLGNTPDWGDMASSNRVLGPFVLPPHPI